MKLIIGSVLAFSLVILFLFALFPTDISVTRILQINASPGSIVPKMADLREWKSWNSFLYDARGGGISVIRSNSNLIQRENASVELLRVVPDTIQTRWQHGNKFFNSNFIIRGNRGMSTVEWTLYFHVKWYPWDKMSSMFYDKQLGPSMENSLLNLKNELEKKGQ